LQVADKIQIGLLVVNFLVGIVILVYTRETWILRKEAQRQNDRAVVPIVTLESASDLPLREGGTNMASVKTVIRNLGLGPAFNIEIDALERPSTRIRFMPTPSLAAGSREPVEMDIQEDGKQVNSPAYGHIQRMFHRNQLVTQACATLHYQDANGKRYRTTLTFHYDDLTKELSTKLARAEPLDS
jgi:hypothetical protein